MASTKTATVAPANRNGHAADKQAETEAPPEHRVIYEIPTNLKLNLDSMNFDDTIILSDPDSTLSERKAVLDRIVVGGTGDYHVLIIGELSEFVGAELARLIKASQKKRLNPN